MKVVGWAAVMASVWSPSEGYTPLAKHSLIPPFDDFKEHSGERNLQSWRVGGHALAKHNFIRLTEDKQSRRGHLFNTERLEHKEFGMQIKFRISGSGKHLYGDGFGIWFTKKDANRAYFEEGMVLGHTDMFTGFGILFDTFRNVEAGHVHKDISVTVNNGRAPIVLDKERPGCESHYRFYEGREDFDVEQASVARIWLEKNRVSLEVDKYGKGDFKKCFDVDLGSEEYKMPADWQDSYFISVSGSTGALADNHDILEIKTAEPSKFQHLLKLDEEEKDSPAVQIELHPKLRAEEVGEHVNDLAFEVSDINKALSKLQHKIEHDMEKLKTRLEGMMKKLEEKEDGSESRIGDLEKAREKSLENKLDERLEKLEDQMHTKIESRLALLETKVGVKINETVASTGGWKVPLIAVVVGVGAYMAYTLRSLNKLHRRDKLI